jgi:NACHT domain
MDLDGCEPGTRTDVTERIRRWGNDSAGEKQIFWLSGQSGSGKTAVAVTMYKEWEREGRLGGRFFFSKDVMATSTTQKFCVAVARDIAAHIPSLQPTIAAAIKDAAPAYFPLELQLQKMIIKPVETYGRPVFIVIDGLDSVSDPQERHRLLGCLTKELSNVRDLKVLLCSPVLPDIEEALGTPDLVERYNIYLPDSKEGEIDPDITLYIEKHLKNLNEDTEDQKGKGTVASLSKGYFQWLVPATFLLKRNRSGSELMETLINIDSTNHFDGLYYLYLQRVVHKMWPSELKMDLLCVVIAALQPISLATLHSFLPRSTYDIDGVRTLVYQLRGLLKVGDSDIPIRVRHSSFRDFCTDPARAREFHVNLAVTHNLLALKCLELLDPCLHYNILGIELGGVVIPQNIQISKLDTLLKGRLSPAIAYASSYWPFHAVLASRSQVLFDAVKRFLNCQLLYWVELMSWRGCVEEAIDGLFYLQTAVRSLISNAGDALVSLAPPIVLSLTNGQGDRCLGDSGAQFRKTKQGSC